MNEANGFGSGEPSQYDDHDKHRPLLDLEFKKGLGGRVIGTIFIGVVVVWGLIINKQGWWALGAAVVAIGSLVEPVMQFTIDRVRILKDGVFATYLIVPWNGKPAWRQFPWSSILHLDLSDGNFRVATTKESSSYGHVYTYMGKMDKKEKTKLVNELKSLQQRGDIPSTVRIVVD
jgi:hypothetical protein